MELGFSMSMFLGRFHPILVHLPIGIILITILLEWRGRSAPKTLQSMWFYGAMSAVASAVIGWMLVGNSTYAPNTLFWHKWIGIAMCLFSIIIWLSYRAEETGAKLIMLTSRAGMAGLLMLGGHLGGTLTHGDGFLVKDAPLFIKKIVGYNESVNVDLSTLPIDSIETYTHLIRPVFENKCLSCHNDKSSNGGLDMSTIDALKTGGDNGVVIVAKDAVASELFHRITMSQSSSKFMPPKGTPMSYYEIELVKWWINNGASFDELTSAQTLSTDIISNLAARYKVDFTPRPWYQKETVAGLSDEAIAEIASQGYRVEELAHDVHFLSVVVDGKRDIKKLGLDQCLDQVLLLDLKNSILSGEAVAAISDLKNLSRLKLNNTNVTSDDILKIDILPRLESLNLYGTAVDDRSLEHLKSFPSLKRIYLWQTQVTEGGIEEFKKSRVDIEVILGV